MDEQSETRRPHKPTEGLRRGHRWMALLSLFSGGYILALSTGLFTTASNPLLVPRWIGVACSIMFLAAGLAITKRDSRVANNALAACILGLGTIVAAWAAITSPPGTISGLPIPLSAETHETLSRIGFTVAAILAAGMTAYAIRRTLAAVRARR